MLTESITGFTLVLARVSGLAVFLPWPGARQTPPLARAAFALILTLVLAPVWPRVPAEPALATWLAAEAAIGITIGLAFALVNDCFAVAGQLLGLQAGFSYASSVDPSSQADTTVIPVLTQLLTNLLFFALGLDRQLVALLAASLETCPPGACVAEGSLAAVTKLAGMALTAGVRLALPLIALMVATDLLLALLGRFCPQFQITSSAFPLKIAMAIFLLAMLMPLMIPAYENLARQALLWTARLMKGSG
jgi:flagellar biosynthetic protein FliR